MRISAEKADDRIVVKIRDNGPGMSEEIRKNIFKPFYTTKEQGTGLGLYVTQQLVEKNRGRIRVESTLGVGTVFILSFYIECS